MLSQKQTELVVLTVSNPSPSLPNPRKLSFQQSAPVQPDSSGPVIILDDDLDVANTVAAALGVLGHRAVVTSSAAEFYGLVDRLSPSHLVIDLFMPEIDGLAVLRDLSGRTSARIIVTSGHKGRLLESMRQSAVALGLDVVGRLEKPFRLAKLRELMTIPATFQPESRQPCDYSESEMSLENILAGLNAGEFRLYLQAKIICATQAIVGYEALVRWDHPVHGIIQPALFVPQIEAAGMEHLLARYMIDNAMAFLAAHAESTFHIAINVSLDTFRSPCFRAGLAGLRAKHDVASQRIILELTETGGSELTVADIEKMTRIRLDGFLLSLDDFGKGLSSIQRLVQLPFSEVKIDRIFIRDVTTSEEARKLIGFIIAMGTALGITTTAEGIEDAATFDVLKKLGCTNVQGFLFGRPFPVSLANRCCN